MTNAQLLRHRLGQPVKLDVQEVGWAVNPAKVQDFPQSDDLKGLFGQNYLRIVPTLAGHADLIVPDGLKNERAAMSARFVEAEFARREPWPFPNFGGIPPPGQNNM